MPADKDRDKIVAEYASGRDVVEIERRYGLTRAQIERLVANETARRRVSISPAMIP